MATKRYAVYRYTDGVRAALPEAMSDDEGRAFQYANQTAGMDRVVVVDRRTEKEVYEFQATETLGDFFASFR